MAAAAIGIIAPLVAPLLPVIANDLVTFIANIVHPQVKAAQAAKAPGTGPAVFADVLMSVTKSLISTHAAGQFPGGADIPDPAIIKIIIQAVYTAMNLSAPAPPAVLTQTLTATSDPVPLVLSLGKSYLVTTS